MQTLRIEMEAPNIHYNEAVEGIRKAEFPFLDGNTYLDHAGTTLYSKSLIKQISRDLSTNLYGNPHSHSSPSMLSGMRVEKVREKALRFFNANPDEFDLVFVPNATAAVKIVAEGFKSNCGLLPGTKRRARFWYGYHSDCHTSLVGVREGARSAYCFKDDAEVKTWIGSGQVFQSDKKLRRETVGLFAYPGQSNFTGRRLPLDWSRQIRASKRKFKLFTLLDAAALAASAPIDLSDETSAPDFMCVSFYKIFGFPDLGALIVRKNSAHMLEKRDYFGGGTVDMVIAINEAWHVQKETLHDRLEDGTLAFHSIIALDHAIDTHQKLFGSMKQISSHTSYLIAMLVDGIRRIVHFNGQPVCVIYNDPTTEYGNAACQGGTVAFNIIQADGSFVGYTEVETAADSHNIYLRSGSLCNPGGFANYLGFSAQELRTVFQSGHSCTHPLQTALGRPTGVVRASVGAMSTEDDVRTLLDFIRRTYVQLGSSNPATNFNLDGLTTDNDVHARAEAKFPPRDLRFRENVRMKLTLWRFIYRCK